MKIIKNKESEKGKSESISPYCIYTIKHSDDLKNAFKKGRQDSFVTNQKWKTGDELLNKAKEKKMQFPVIFSAAEDCWTLIYWGILTKIKINRLSDHKYTTTYNFKNLTKIRGDKFKADLILRSTNKAISEGFIRPYAICKTPKFIKL